MRKNISMTFNNYTRNKGYMGHWSMNYIVVDIIDTDTGESIGSTYTFRGTKIFKGMKLKCGDKVSMLANVETTPKLKITYPNNIVTILGGETTE